MLALWRSMRRASGAVMGHLSRWGRSACSLAGDLPGSRAAHFVFAAGRAAQQLSSPTAGWRSGCGVAHGTPRLADAP